MNKKGSILLSLTFFILVSIIGASLINTNKLHFKLNRIRNDKIFNEIEFKSEINEFLKEMKQGMFEYRILNKDDFNKYLKYLIIDRDFEVKGVSDYSIAEYNLNDKFINRSKYGFYLKNKSYNLKYYVKIIIDNIKGKASSEEFGVIFNKEDDDSDSDFLKRKKINYDLSTRINRVNSEEINFKFEDFLINKMKIKTGKMDWKSIRLALNLEEIDKALEDGIYFSYKDNNLDFIFVQGNLDRMVIYERDDYQNIELVQGDIKLELKYKPGSNGIYVLDDWNDCFFKENFIINGDLLSLEQYDDFAFASNTNLNIAVSGRVVIRSNLISKDIKIMRKNYNNLNLVVSNRFFSNETERAAEIFIEKNIKTIDLGIVTNGKIVNNSSNLTINGTLFAKDFENNGSVFLNYYKNPNDFSDYFFIKVENEIFRFFIFCFQEVYYE